MADWTIASRFLDELLRQAGGRGHLDCAPENLVLRYSAAFPTEANCQDARARVRRLLDTLADAKAIVLPKGEKYWLPFPPPKLPMWIKFPTPAQKEKDERHKVYPWGPELAFLASLPSVPHLNAVVAVNTWLRDGGRDTSLMVPLRERSIEITGDEKALDAVVRCQALQPEPAQGVTLNLLKAFLAPPPLAYERGPEGTAGMPVLVIENAHTWHSFATWNRTAGRYAAVIYGNGKSFIASVPHIRNIITEVNAARDVRYFGDLDPAGLAIPIEAGEVAWEHDIPLPMPEQWLYEELLQHQSQHHRRNVTCSSESTKTVVGWLPVTCRDAGAAILSRGERIAQEYVGSAFLLSPNRRL